MRFGLPQMSLSRGANKAVNGNTESSVPRSQLPGIMWLQHGKGRENACPSMPEI